MEINRLALGGLLAGCMAVGGGVGYFAMQHDGVSGVETTAAAADEVATAELAPGAVPGAASEGDIPAATGDTAPVTPAPEVEPTAPEASPSPAARPAPARRRTAPTRPAAPPAQTAPAEATPTTTNQSMWEPRPPVEQAGPVETAPEPGPQAAIPELVDLIVPADSVLGLQVERAISSEGAQVEDRVEARVTRDVRVDGRVAIPAGAVVQGSVTDVVRGGKIRERARLGIRFHTILLADGTRLNIRTDTITRQGQAPAAESSAKIGGAAAGGAILGAILGGGRGAAIGGAIGAAGGTAATMAGGRNPAVLSAGTTLSVRIQQPVTVTIEK